MDLYWTIAVIASLLISLIGGERDKHGVYQPHAGWLFNAVVLIFAFQVTQ